MTCVKGEIHTRLKGLSAECYNVVKASPGIKARQVLARIPSNPPANQVSVCLQRLVKRGFLTSWKPKQKRGCDALYFTGIQNPEV